MDAQTALLLIVASHAAYAVLLVARALLTRDRRDTDNLTDGAFHGVAAYTALVWGPLWIAYQALGHLVLDPLRLSFKWGALHHGENTVDGANAKHRFKGRVMRKVLPGVSVGTYTRRRGSREHDYAWGTQANRLFEVGTPKVGFTVIRYGRFVPDPPRPDKADAGPVDVEMVEVGASRKGVHR